MNISTQRKLPNRFNLGHFPRPIGSNPTALYFTPKFTQLQSTKIFEASYRI